MNKLTIPLQDLEIQIQGWGKITINKLQGPTLNRQEIVVSYDGITGGCSSVDKKRRVRK